VAIVIGILIGLPVGALAVAASLRFLGGTKLEAARRARQLILTDAKREAESVKREAQLASKEEAVRLRSELERDLQERRGEAIQAQERLRTTEAEIGRRETEVERREQGVADREQHARQLQDDLKAAKEQELNELERISGLTLNEAKAEVLSRSEEVVRHELARRVRQLEEEAHQEARRRARNLVADSLQRVAASHAAETTVSIVELPSDDMKGRIIGREGRNIRALEHLTGVDFIIDDTPHAVGL
jgi:ribonuclease Y